MTTQTAPNGKTTAHQTDKELLDLRIVFANVASWAFDIIMDLADEYGIEMDMKSFTKKFNQLLQNLDDKFFHFEENNESLKKYLDEFLEKNPRKLKAASLYNESNFRKMLFPTYCEFVGIPKTNNIIPPNHTLTNRNKEK